MHKTYATLKGFLICRFHGIVEEYNSFTGTNYGMISNYGDGDGYGNATGTNRLNSLIEIGDGDGYGDSLGDSKHDWGEQYFSFEDNYA